MLGSVSPIPQQARQNIPCPGSGMQYGTPLFPNPQSVLSVRVVLFDGYSLSVWFRSFLWVHILSSSPHPLHIRLVPLGISPWPLTSFLASPSAPAFLCGFHYLLPISHFLRNLVQNTILCFHQCHFFSLSLPRSPSLCPPPLESPFTHRS